MSAQTNKPAIAPSKEDAKKEDKKTAIRYPFWFGGSASSMAACVTHPLDLGELRSPLLPVSIS
jgi:dicarboxylate transporter 10